LHINIRMIQIKIEFLNLEIIKNHQKIINNICFS